MVVESDLVRHVTTAGPGTNWTLIGTYLIVLFTGLTALVAYMAYRHGRVSTGHHRRAVRIRRGSIDPQWFVKESLGERMGAFSFYNNSDVDQPFSIESCRVVWPLGLVGNYSQGEFYFPPSGVHSRASTESIVVRVSRKDGKPCVTHSCLVLVRIRDEITDRRTRHSKKIRLVSDASGWGY